VTTLPGGTIPPHDGSGSIHVGFAVDTADLPAWEARLTEQGVEILSRVTWPRGGRSIYFRDPDGHLLELLTPGVWSTY
jgi:catechol 2,3-dioxygenase-like lactoylglutathione lyase family enzyme